jgi:Flp pilus assembly protein TadB
MAQTKKGRREQKATMTTKLTSALFLLVVAGAILSAIAPTVEKLISALTPLVLIIGVIVIALRLTDFYTRR